MKKLNDFESKMLLQVHDELVFDAKNSEVGALTSMIKTEMEQAYILQVPLVVDVGTGTNWLEAH
jgi:DNA polymerase-1